MKNFPCNVKIQGIACQVLHSLSFAQNNQNVRNKLMDAVGVVGIALERYHRFYNHHHIHIHNHTNNDVDHIEQIKFFGSEFMKRIV